MTSRGAVLSAAVIIAALVGGCTQQSTSDRGEPAVSARQEEHPYVGMWVTADNHIRQELLPHGRYDEARGQRASAYMGRYWVSGTRIEYEDDTGFTADGEFDGDVLHHGGYVFYREGSQAHRDAVAGTARR
jgi:hypothetical protein